MSGEPNDALFDANTQLDYQTVAIVSRVVLKQPSGSVTAFAFDARQELSEHTSPYEALIQVLEGEAEITIGGEPHQVRAGQMIVLPGRVPHAVKAPRQFKMVLTMLRTSP